MRKGGHKKNGWERPKHGHEGSIISAKPGKPSKPRNSTRNGERHTQPLCKSRAKSKGNRKAQGHDLGADYRLYNWAPFAGRESVRKVSLDVDRYNEDLGIALSLSLLESQKAKKSSAAVEEFEEFRGFEPGKEEFEEFEGDFEDDDDDDDASLPEIEVSENGDDTLAQQGVVIEEEIGGEFAPEIDNLCGDLTGVEEVSSDGEDGWSWESFSSASEDAEVDEDEEYEFVDKIRDEEKWSMVSVY